MNKLIACCGLDCEKCDARVATLHNDGKLRKKTADLWSKLNGVKITSKLINCTGCRIQGVKTQFCEEMCQIRKCVREKKFNTCAECNRIMNCKILEKITLNNVQALKNLSSNDKLCLF